jgi:FMN-dependent oxidoreductase (nitrilotriacetate monooxygenase family)
MFHLGWFLTTGFGVYGWGQPWSGNTSADVGQPSLYVEAATTLERAGFTYMMLEDSSVLPDVYKSSFERSVAAGVHVRFDPMPLIPLMAQATSKIGIIATVATTFYPPFLAARLFTTLDNVTNGRVGMNLVTGSPHAAAQNYGYDEHFEHDLRYEMADEWVDVVSQLWESWEPDAAVLDDTGLFADHTKIHTVDFAGKFYKSRGPLNCPPGPQRRPVLCQAGGSGPGKDFGAKHADTIIASVNGVAEMKAYREDISARMISYGRDPKDVKVLYLVTPILGDTDQEAYDKRDRMNAAARNNIEGRLAAMSYFTSQDFSKFDLDAPMPDMSKNNGHRSSMEAMSRLGTTLREVATNSKVASSVDLAGTPSTVAAQMDEIMQEVGGDGYLIAAPVTRKNLTEIADGLAPELRRRGLIRDGYEHELFRDNLMAF